jgi:hypothetical protein
MSQFRFCSKCGASLFEAEDRCRLCRTPVAEMTIAPPRPAAAASDGDASPFVSIWLHPRDTIRGILDRDPTYLVIPLAAVGGIFQAISRASDRNAADLLSLPVVLLIALIGGPIGGLLGLYVAGGLLSFTGRWLGGNASAQEVRASVAWGTVPGLWGGLLWIPIIALGGSAMFTSDFENAGGMVLLVCGGMLLVQAAAYIWSIFTSLHSLGEAQGFSAWKALGNSVLAFLVIVVPLVGIGIMLAIVIPMAVSASGR